MEENASKLASKLMNIGKLILTARKYMRSVNFIVFELLHVLSMLSMLVKNYTPILPQLLIEVLVLSFPPFLIRLSSKL